jgi:hypothetical protein
MSDMTYGLITPQAEGTTNAPQGAKRRNMWARLCDAVIELRMRQAQRIVERKLGRRLGRVWEPKDLTGSVSDDVNPKRDWLCVSRPRG